jgi:putative nucleotidyltransferase with HDIG domain
MTNNKDDAWNLVQEFVQDSGLRRHILSVAAAMRFYAQRLGQDAEQWEIIGLLHDFDWEIHPDLDRHPVKGSEILRERGWDEETNRIILSHYTEGTGVEREKPVDYALLACDEITGLVIATALVRPSKDVREVRLKSIRKKWKNRRFAGGVDRDHVEEVTADFSRMCFDGGLSLWDHVANVLEAMQGDAVRLGLDGSLTG